jgi:hypothetical protein
MCGTATCFCLFQPSPGRYWTKKSSVMASYVISEQQQSKNYKQFKSVERKKADTECVSQ